MIPMDPVCPRCAGRHGVEVSGDGYEHDCAACGGRLMCSIGERLAALECSSADEDRIAEIRREGGIK